EAGGDLDVSAVERGAAARARGDLAELEALEAALLVDRPAAAVRVAASALVLRDGDARREALAVEGAGRLADELVVGVRQRPESEREEHDRRELSQGHRGG